MLAVITLSVLITCCTGTPLSAVWLSPIAPVAPIRQYQTQDGLGSSYHYAYTGPHNSKVETRLGDTIQGGYSYIDANGILQTVAYTADGLNGYRVEENNFPKNERENNEDKLIIRPVKGIEDISENIELNVDKKKLDEKNLQSQNKWQLINGVEKMEKPNNNNNNNNNNNEQLENKIPDMIKNPFIISKININDQYSKDIGTTMDKNLDSQSSFLSSNKAIQNNNNNNNNDNDKNNINQSIIGNRFSQYQNTVGIPHYVFPIVPYRMMHSSLHHTQDSLGQYDYSYTGDTSAKTESRSLDGTTRGAYSYVDANGILQQVHYIADENGFRVAATNLPEAK